jgi:hypothetical protein
MDKFSPRFLDKNVFFFHKLIRSPDQDERGADRDPGGEPGAAAEHDDVQVHRLLSRGDLHVAEVPLGRRSSENSNRCYKTCKRR